MISPTNYPPITSILIARLLHDQPYHLLVTDKLHLLPHPSTLSAIPTETPLSSTVFSASLISNALSPTCNSTMRALHDYPGLSVVSPRWELIDPNPDVFVLFQHFDAAFFSSKLNAVEIRWSPRMTT